MKREKDSVAGKPGFTVAQETVEEEKRELVNWSIRDMACF